MMSLKIPPAQSPLVMDVNIMVVVVYKCTLNLVSPAPLTSDWARAECKCTVSSASSQLASQGRATCQASVADVATRLQTQQWPRLDQTRSTQVYSCTDKNVRNQLLLQYTNHNDNAIEQNV